MMQSGELRDVMLSFYGALGSGDLTFFDRHFSSAEHVRGIGTDPAEWWSGGATVGDIWKRQMKAMGGVLHIAEMLAHVVGFDGGIGFRSEVRDGHYTGRAAGPFTYRSGKAEAVRQIAERDGIDLSESYAYSDSESDLPMLRLVGHPVAVNPDDELRRVVREEGWRVIHFDRLRRRLRIAVAAGALAAAGGGGGYLAARLRPERRLAWRARHRPLPR